MGVWRLAHLLTWPTPLSGLAAGMLWAATLPVGQGEERVAPPCCVHSVFLPEAL